MLGWAWSDKVDQKRGKKEEPRENHDYGDRALMKWKFINENATASLAILQLKQKMSEKNKTESQDHNDDYYWRLLVQFAARNRIWLTSLLSDKVWSLRIFVARKKTFIVKKF